MKKRLLGYYNYTVILTYSGMLSAFLGILKVMCGNYDGAVLCLMIAAVCDMFDGMVAATKARDDREKRFGIQIDSLSDLISFGVLPGVFVYRIAEERAWIGVIAAAFVLCALIRLAYFNVLEEERQKQTPEKRKSYLGVPVTVIAVMLPLVFLLYKEHICRNRICFPILLIVMGFAYLMPIEIKKPGIIGKIGLILLGILEGIGLLLFMGGDIV